ncbi:MAG: nuclear transport factor 2 family protein [Anaerolineae bacterium]
MNDTSVTVETLKAFLDAFNRHDLDAIMSFFADDCVFYLPRGSEPWGTRFVGQDAVREGLASRFAGIQTYITGMIAIGRAADSACLNGSLPGQARPAGM